MNLKMPNMAWPSLALNLAFVTLILSVANFELKAQSTNNQLGVTKNLTRNGIGLVTADSLFSMNFRFRMQSRFLMATHSMEDFSPTGWEARVRRTRLSLTGHVVDPRLTYYLQLSFSRADMDWNMNDVSTVNTSPNVVRDAMIFFKPIPKLQLGFGQGKLPGNRQRVVSSGALQFYDRSIANALFTLDRDFGFFATYTQNAGSSVILIKGALTSGEGRNTTVSNSGLAYTSRVEFLPFGNFTDGGDYFEGDLVREKSPKLSIAAGYHFNDLAVRTQGQLGRDLYRPVTYDEYLADLLFKYRGIALSAEYMQRNSNVDPITKSGTSTRYLVSGNGYNLQLSYCFKSLWEIAGRFSKVTPDSKVSDYMVGAVQHGAGVTKYLMKHKVKFQFNVMYNRDYWTNTDKISIENMLGVFQVELGI